MMKVFVGSFNLLKACPRLCQARFLSLSSLNNGIEEFFPPGVYDEGKYIEENPVIGRRWKSPELRIRSNVDLHKFWYVLLKERNMLLTMHQECKRLGIPVPAPTRLHKVRVTMNLIKKIIEERNNAILELTKERHYEFDEKYENQSYDATENLEEHFEAIDERNEQSVEKERESSTAV